MRIEPDEVKGVVQKVFEKPTENVLFSWNRGTYGSLDRMD
jgi:hypothetical protein